MYRSYELLENLQKQYSKYNQLIIAYDFDDTVRERNPDKPYEGVVGRHKDVVKLLQRAKEKINNAKFICYTARDHNNPLTIEYITQFCKENNIPLDTINENIITWYESPSKLFYNIFLDDKAGLETAVYVLENFIDSLATEKIPNGEYFGIWGGYEMKIYDSKMNYLGKRKTKEEVRGSKIKSLILIHNNELQRYITI